MKAITYRKYGPPEVLRLEEIQKPVPKENEILIRIYASAVNSADWRLRKPDPQAVRLVFGLTKPRNIIPGVILAGLVETVGSKVTTYKPGDKVFGSAGMRMRAYAEFICLKEKAILEKIPDKVSFEDAAAIVFGGMTAYHFLKKANIQKSDKVLVYGASGSVGTAAVQLAKLQGAEVTAVCSETNKSLLKTLGADFVLDYKKPDFKLPQTSYDLVFVAIGKITFSDCIKSLKPEGKLILSDAGIGDTLRGLAVSLFGKHKVFSGVASETKESLRYLAEQTANKKFKPVIDKIYAMSEIVGAHTYAESGHKKGNVVIKISND